MAATYPSGDEDRDDSAYERPTLASATSPTRRPAWIGVVVAIVVLAVIAVVAYLLLYNGGSSTGGGGNGGGGGNSGYLVLAFSGKTVRRLARRIRH
jgi:hypothetical protein